MSYVNRKLFRSKTIVKKLEKTGDILNFFFLEYYDGDKPGRVTLTFYGDEKKVMDELKKYGIKPNIKEWDPASQHERFGDDYQLGIRIFEIGSRLALCKIDDKYPVDNTGKPDPILVTLRHVFLQNLGYSGEEEKQFGSRIDLLLSRAAKMMFRFDLK